MAKRFRKKPIEIEAIKFTGKNGKTILKWSGGRAVPGVGSYQGYASEILRIDTLEGRMIAGPGEWIIKGVVGEIYPCKPDVFKATYEPAADAAGKDGDKR